MPTLKELKALVKSHSTDKPKLSAGKEALLVYAHANGLLKPKEEAAPVAPEKTSKKLVKLVTPKDELPKILKAPVKESKKMEPPKKESSKVEPPVKQSKKIKSEDYSGNKVEVAAPTPAKGGFAGFMSVHKGQGYNMKQLAEMYKSSKSE